MRRCTRSLVLSGSVLLLLFTLNRAGWAQKSAAPHPPLVPLLWTQGQPEATIREAVREVAWGGNTGFVWESRPHPDYLGEKWWADLGAAIDEARKLNLEVWIFDEWMYPSGVAGGKVVQQNRDFALHTVEERSISVRGPTAEREWDIPSPLASGEKLLSVVAFPTPYRAGAPPVRLTPSPGASSVRCGRRRKARGACCGASIVFMLRWAGGPCAT